MEHLQRENAQQHGREMEGWSACGAAGDVKRTTK